MTIVKKFVAPALTVPPVVYDQMQQTDLIRQLRLYFNLLDRYLNDVTNALNDPGSVLKFPYGAFHQDGVTTLSANITNNSTTPIQVASTANFPAAGYILIGTEIIQYTTKTLTTFDGTITRGVLGTTNVAHTAGAAISEVQGTGLGTTIGDLLFNSTDYSNGVYVDPLDLKHIIFSEAGLYNIAISAQLLSFDNNADNVTIWFRKNSVDIPVSASIGTVPPIHGGIPGSSIMAVNIILELNAGDYISVKWTSDSGNSVVATYPAGTSPVHPVSPAIILTAQFVSALP